MKHQIITIGKDLASVYLGLKEFNPDNAHLIITPQTEGIYSSMLEMLPETMKVSTYLVDPYGWKEVEDACREIHRVNTGDFSYNISEGTKVMSFAALSVAQENNAYVFSITQRGNIINLTTKERKPLSQAMNNKEFIQLYGGNLHTYNDLKRLLEEDVVASYAINEFIENHRKEYERVQTYFRRSCGGQISRFPSKVTLSNNMSIISDDRSFRIMKYDKTLLNVKSNTAKQILLEGRWWEIMVAKEIKTWVLSNREMDRELWQSVIFEDRTHKQTKNEVDILINDHHKLLIVECKSGHVSQGDIYKLDSVRETYGGDASKAILVSYYPVDEFLQEKCEDLQINLFAPIDRNSRIGHLSSLPKWLDEVVKNIKI